MMGKKLKMKGKMKIMMDKSGKKGLKAKFAKTLASLKKKKK